MDTTRKSLPVLVALVLCLGSARAPAAPPSAAPAGAPARPTVFPPLPAPVADPAAEARIRALIAAIEDKPSGLIVNNSGRIDAPPANQPYNPDGSRNENFRVTPNPSSGQAALLQNPEQRRSQALAELIRIGRPAVPFLCMALMMEAYEHRPLYAQALGEIKDPRAVPHLLKYFEDGKMKVSLAATVARSGDAAMAKKLEDEGRLMMTDATAALAKITGRNFGPDLGKWRQWWEENKAKVGPTPPVVLY